MANLAAQRDGQSKKYSVIAWDRDGEEVYADTRVAANAAQRAMITGRGECASATIYDRDGKPLSDKARKA